MAGMSYKKQKIIIVITFLFVPVLMLAVFGYYPALKLVQLSFTDWKGIEPIYNYVGFENYKTVLQNPDYLITFVNMLAYVIGMLVQLLLGLYLAIILDGKIRARNFFKSSIFMPYILNGVAVAFMFSFLFNYEKSPINIILNNIGLGQYAIKFLANSYLTNFSLAYVGLWQFLGMTMVIFLGALQSIPRQLYESALIDGANFYHMARYITLPSIKKVVEINLFLGITGALQALTQPLLITLGGPGNRTMTFMYKIINEAFKFKKFGEASAMAVVLVIIILVLVGLQRLVVNRRGGEGNEV